MICEIQPFRSLNKSKAATKTIATIYQCRSGPEMLEIRSRTN